jgi:hypothetical protein
LSLRKIHSEVWVATLPAEGCFYSCRRTKRDTGATVALVFNRGDLVGTVDVAQVK